MYCRRVDSLATFSSQTVWV